MTNVQAPNAVVWGKRKVVDVNECDNDNLINLKYKGEICEEKKNVRLLTKL